MNYRIIDHSLAPVAGKYLGYLYDLSNRENVESLYWCIPKATICLTFCLSGQYYFDANGTWVPQPAVSIFGLIRKRHLLKMSPNYREITIGFYPHLFQMLTTESMSSLFQDNIIDPTIVFARDTIDKLQDGLSESKSDAEIVRHIDAFLHNHLLNEKFDRRLFAAYDLITKSSIYRVDILSDQLNLSPSRLRDLFRSNIGLSPKEIIKLVRIKKVLGGRITSNETLTRLAHDLGYFDQSHFIHEFQSVLDMTPKEYFKNSNLTDDFYNYSRLRLSSFAENQR